MSPAPEGLVVPVAVGVLGLAGIAILHDIPVRHGIEDDLTGRSTLALNAAGLSTAEVSFSGRDAVISDVPQTQAQRARDVVLAVRGVRVARVEATATPISSAPSGQPRNQSPVSLTFDGDTVTLTGWVSAAGERSRLTAAIEAAGWQVRDELAVDPTLAALGGDFATGLAVVADTVPQPATRLIVRYSEGGAEVRGTVASAAAEASILAAVRVTVPSGGSTEDHVEVPSPTPQAEPEPTRAPAEALRTELRALPPITFRPGSAELTDAGERVVADAAKLIKASAPLKIRVDGHTDSSGSAARNQLLSQRRADAVRDRLESLGVRGLLPARGFGETRPQREPGTAPQNRRVEFTLL